MAGALLLYGAAGVAKGIVAGMGFLGTFPDLLSYSGYDSGNGLVGAAAIGTIDDGLTAPGGYTITQLCGNSQGNFIFAIAGNHTGSIFATLYVGASSFARSAASTPSGVYNAPSGSTFWSWSGDDPPLADGVRYAVRFA
jgi:hypothetical protein